MFVHLLFAAWMVGAVFQSAAISINGNPLFFWFIFQILLLITAFSAKRNQRMDQDHKFGLQLMVLFFLVMAGGCFILPNVFAGTLAFVPRLTIDEQVLSMNGVEFGITNLTVVAYMAVNVCLLLIVARGKAGDLTRAFELAATPAALTIAVSIALDSLKPDIWTQILEPMLRHNEQGAIFTDLMFDDIRRLSGLFSEPSYAGIFCAGLSCYFFALAIERRSIWELAKSLVMLVCIVLTTSFVGICGVVLGAGLLLVRYGSTQKSLRIGIPLLITTGLIAATLADMDFVFTVYFDKFASASALNRFASDARSLEILTETNFLGVGMGSHRGSSLLFTLMANTGIIGTGLYLTCTAVLIGRKRHIVGRDIYGPLQLYSALLFLLLLIGNAEIGSPAYWVGLIALVSARTAETVEANHC